MSELELAAKAVRDAREAFVACIKKRDALADDLEKANAELSRLDGFYCAAQRHLMAVASHPSETKPNDTKWREFL